MIPSTLIWVVFIRTIKNDDSSSFSRETGRVVLLSFTDASAWLIGAWKGMQSQRWSSGPTKVKSSIKTHSFFFTEKVIKSLLLLTSEFAFIFSNHFTIFSLTHIFLNWTFKNEYFNLNLYFLMVNTLHDPVLLGPIRGNTEILLSHESSVCLVSYLLWQGSTSSKHEAAR